MAIVQALPEIRLVLDTDVFTYYRGQNPRIKQAVGEYISRLKDFPRLTAITVFETLHGFEKKAKSGALDVRTSQDRLKTEELIQAWGVLPFNETAATIAAYIYPRLPRKAQKKLWADVFIAATALAHGYGVATRNQRDFELIAQHLPPSHSLLRLAVWKP